MIQSPTLSRRNGTYYVFRGCETRGFTVRNIQGRRIRAGRAQHKLPTRACPFGFGQPDMVGSFLHLNLTYMNKMIMSKCSIAARL